MVKNHPEGAAICVQRQVSCQIRCLQETIRTQRTAVHVKCQDMPTGFEMV